MTMILKTISGQFAVHSSAPPKVLKYNNRSSVFLCEQDNLACI